MVHDVLVRERVDLCPERGMAGEEVIEQVVRTPGTEVASCCDRDDTIERDRIEHVVVAPAPFSIEHVGMPAAPVRQPLRDVDVALLGPVHVTRGIAAAVIGLASLACRAQTRDIAPTKPGAPCLVWVVGP